MITKDAVGGILQRKAEVWEREILDYIEKYSHNMIARKVLPIRNVGKDAEIDVVSTYESTGRGAIIAAKGVVPSGSKVKVKSTSHTIYQILDGFDLHEKDLNIEPKLKNRNVDLCMRNVHKAEDELALNGKTSINVNGISDAPALSSNTTTAAQNHGAWDGSEANDIHADIIRAINQLDTDFDAAWILGNPIDINYLNALDSERQPYWRTIVDLFDGATKKTDFLFKSNRITAGTVYVGVKDILAAELVVSENATVATLPMQRGRLYPVEIYEWVTVEIHNTNAFASIVTT